MTEATAAIGLVLSQSRCESGVVFARSGSGFGGLAVLSAVEQLEDWSQVKAQSDTSNTLVWATDPRNSKRSTEQDALTGNRSPRTIKGSGQVRSHQIWALPLVVLFDRTMPEAKHNMRVA